MATKFTTIELSQDELDEVFDELEQNNVSFKLENIKGHSLDCVRNYVFSFASTKEQKKAKTLLPKFF